eukprot:scaffold13311_cov161-Cylindrotheca_fusiformis.AAC.7
MDSDSDSSFAHRKRRHNDKAAIAKLDDSDSDDSLLANNKTTFRSSKRKKHTKEDDILNDALKRSKSRQESEQILNKLKHEARHDDDLIESAKTMKEVKEANRAVEKAEKPKTAEALEYHAALEEIADTQSTVTVGSRKTICYQTAALPSSTTQALEYLHFILTEAAKDTTLVQNAFYRNLQNGTLHTFLHTKRLLSPAFPKAATATLPSSLLRWLLEVSCASSKSVEGNKPGLEVFSRGAYLTLSHLWIKRQGFSSDGWFLTTADMPKNLKTWFGVGKSTESSLKEEQLRTEDHATGVSRYLHLWEIAFSQGMVHVTGLKDISRCFILLVVASLDPMFESSQTSATAALRNLQKLHCHLLNAAKDACETCHAFHAWSSEVIREIFATINKLGPAGSGSMPWACLARIVRSMLRENTTAALIPPLGALICQRCFHIPPTEWSEAMSTLTTRWGVEKEKAQSAQLTALTCSFMALTSLRQELERDGETSAAIVEISFICLQAGVASFSNLGARDETLANAYTEFEKELSQIYNQTKSLVLSNPDFLRVNYFCSCFGQYSRLEKVSHQACTEQRQATVDSFFSKNGQTTQT